MERLETITFETLLFPLSRFIKCINRGACWWDTSVMFKEFPGSSSLRGARCGGVQHPSHPGRIAALIGCRANNEQFVEHHCYNHWLGWKGRGFCQHVPEALKFINTGFVMCISCLWALVPASSVCGSAEGVPEPPALGADNGFPLIWHGGAESHCWDQQGRTGSCPVLIATSSCHCDRRKRLKRERHCLRAGGEGKKTTKLKIITS